MSTKRPVAELAFLAMVRRRFVLASTAPSSMAWASLPIDCFVPWSRTMMCCQWRSAADRAHSKGDLTGGDVRQVGVE